MTCSSMAVKPGTWQTRGAGSAALPGEPGRHGCPPRPQPRDPSTSRPRSGVAPSPGRLQGPAPTPSPLRLRARVPHRQAQQRPGRQPPTPSAEPQRPEVRAWCFRPYAPSAPPPAPGQPISARSSWSLSLAGWLPAAHFPLSGTWGLEVGALLVGGREAWGGRPPLGRRGRGASQPLIVVF